MSAFTDRLVAAGVVPDIATAIETELVTNLAKAEADKARLTGLIDTKQAEIDVLKTERCTADAIVTNIRSTLNDPNA